MDVSQRDPTPTWPSALRRTFAWRSVRRSLIAAMIVGTVVNGINQGQELLAGHGPILWKLALTYLTPFFVVSYGSFAAFRAAPAASNPARPPDA